MWSGEHLDMKIGRQVLLDDASLGIREGERVALVGRNGCGKSTLLRIVAGLEHGVRGNIAPKRDLRAAYMPQDVSLHSDKTVPELVREGLEYFESLLERYGNTSQNDPEHLRIEHLITMHDAWDIEKKLEAVLDKLSLIDLSAPFNSLSGGEQRRVMFARAVIAEPELLLLDEPTNHLDVETIEWIEKYLASYRGACLFVTHDRYFLDRIAGRIVELDHGKMLSCSGSYADFMEMKANLVHIQDIETAKRNQFLKKEIEWVRRSPKARLKKNLGRVQRFEELSAVKAPERTGEVELVIPRPERLGNKVVNVKNASLSLGGRELFTGFSFDFTAGSKVGIIGPNGSGKTSFLRMLVGKLQPDSGSVEVADTVRFNYIEQNRISLSPENTVCEEVAGESEVVDLGGEQISIWGYLKRFLFEDERIKTKVKYLSGGEKARLVLAKILKSGGNFLILDEPTNDLDLSTLRILEEALINYPSSLIVVSHDRYFLNRVCNHIIGFSGCSPVLDSEVGDYDYFFSKKQEREAALSAERLPQKKSSAPENTTLSPPPKPSRKKLSYSEERELNSMEERIAEAEQLVADKENAFLEPGFFARNAKEMPRLNAELEEARLAVEALYARWEALEEKRRQLSQA